MSHWRDLSLDDRADHYISAAIAAATDISVRGEKRVEAGYLYCLYGNCEYQTRRQYDMNRHEKTHTTHSPEERLNCPARGCGRTGEYGFVRKDHLREHLRKVHAKDIPQQNRRRRDSLGDIGRYNANLEAPSEPNAQGENYNEMPPPPPMPPMEPVKYSSQNLKPVGLAKSTMLLGNPNDLQRLQSLSSHSSYVAKGNPGTASGMKTSISHDMGEDDEVSLSSTDLKSVRNTQVAPDPKITHGEPISQSVKLRYEHDGLNPNQIGQRPSTISADVERSTMTIMGERGVQDAVKPAKIVSESDNEAQSSILDHSIHTTSLTVIDTDNELMSSVSDDESEQAQYSYGGSVVDDSCSILNTIEHLENLMTAENTVKTYFPGELIEPAKDLRRDQMPVEFPDAVMNLGDTSTRDLLSPEDRISSHIHPVGLQQNITNIKDTDQMNTLRSSLEVVDDQSPHLPPNAQANTKPLRLAPQYDAYVMTLLSLRIELRVWLGRRASFPTIHISTSGETLLEDGFQRIRWTCRCGRRLYDDFEELRPGALEELEQTLNEHNRVRSPEGNGSSQQRSSSIGALWNAAGGVIGSLTGSRPFRNNNLPTLPLHQHHAAGHERNSQSSATSETLFLLMCIPYRKHGTRLVHMNVAELVSDETLFRKLRHEYQSIRGQWTSLFSLWKMVEIQFVRFGLHKHQLIDIKEKNDLPPADLKNEYRYQPIPAETIPPIGTNHLMHLYEHPDHADDVPFCLERIPKKLREQLKLSPHQTPGLLGWGVYFAEGFDWPKFWVFGTVILSLSVLFGVCWSAVRQDIQGGFGVTACIMVAVTFTTGVVQAAVEQT